MRSHARQRDLDPHEARPGDQHPGHPPEPLRGSHRRWTPTEWTTGLEGSGEGDEKNGTSEEVTLGGGEEGGGVRRGEAFGRGLGQFGCEVRRSWGGNLGISRVSRWSPRPKGPPLSCMAW